MQDRLCINGVRMMLRSFRLILCGYQTTAEISYQGCFVYIIKCVTENLLSAGKLKDENILHKTLRTMVKNLVQSHWEKCYKR